MKSDSVGAKRLTAEEVAKSLKGAGWVTIAEALTAFADERVKEALEKMAWGNLQKEARAEALEEAANKFEGPDYLQTMLSGMTVSKIIRALKDKK